MGVDYIEGGYWVRCFKPACLYSCRETYEFSRHFRDSHNEVRRRNDGPDGYMDPLLVVTEAEGVINRTRFREGEREMASAASVTLLEYRTALETNPRTTLAELVSAKRQGSAYNPNTIPNQSPSIARTTAPGALTFQQSGVAKRRRTNTVPTSTRPGANTSTGNVIPASDALPSQDETALTAVRIKVEDDADMEATSQVQSDDEYSEFEDEMDHDMEQPVNSLDADTSDIISIASDRQAKTDAYKKLQHAYAWLMSEELGDEATDAEAMECFIRAWRHIGTDHPTLRPEQTKPFYMCYECQKMFARRHYVEIHFWRDHKHALHLYQPSRVPMVLCDIETRKPIRLLGPLMAQAPKLMGISVELRRLILRELLVPSQHPLAPRAEFHYEVLELRELTEEAADVLEKDNFLVKISVEYDKYGTIRNLMTQLKGAIPTRIQGKLADKLTSPALSLYLRTKDATKASSQLTIWIFSYNERSFSQVVNCLTCEGSKLSALEIIFGSRSAHYCHLATRADAVRYLAYLRDMPVGHVSVQGVKAGGTGLPLRFDPVDLIHDVEQSLVRNATPEGAMELYQLLITQGQRLRDEGKHSAAFETFWFGHYLEEMIEEFDDDIDPDVTWTYLRCDLACQMCLGACNALLDSFKAADENARLQHLTVSEIRAAAECWGTAALQFCGISDDTRAAAHYARARAYVYLSMVEQICGSVADGENAVLSLHAAATDLFFASLLMNDSAKENVLMELKGLEHHPNLEGVSDEGFFDDAVRHVVVGYDVVWEGDSRLTYEEDELLHIDVYRERPLGWESGV